MTGVIFALVLSIGWGASASPARAAGGCFCTAFNDTQAKQITSVQLSSDCPAQQQEQPATDLTTAGACTGAINRQCRWDGADQQCYCKLYKECRWIEKAELDKACVCRKNNPERFSPSRAVAGVKDEFECAVRSDAQTKGSACLWDRTTGKCLCGPQYVETVLSQVINADQCQSEGATGTNGTCTWEQYNTPYCCCRQFAGQTNCVQLYGNGDNKNKECNSRDFPLRVADTAGIRYKTNNVPTGGTCLLLEERTVCCCQGKTCNNLTINNIDGKGLDSARALSVCQDKLGTRSPDVQARNLPVGGKCSDQSGSQIAGTINPATYDLLQRASVLNQLKQFSGSQALGPAIVAWAINILHPVAVLGSLTLLLYIYAGFMWMTASGNAERAEGAKRMLVWTTLGLAGILASYIITNFLFRILVPA